MIIEDYVSFEVAKLLKEKGFDGVCRAGYTSHGNLNVLEVKEYLTNQTCPDTYWACAAPTLQMAMKWLREVHNSFISIIFCTYPAEKRVTWTPEISTFDSVFPESAIEYDSYEEACEAAIKYCLENLI